MHGAATDATDYDSSRRRFVYLLVVLAGLLLRLYFLRHHAFVSDDSLLYQEIAGNWVHEHVYALSRDTGPQPTLIRLPGYPAVLAACALIFRGRPTDGTLHSFMPVLWLQIFGELAACWMLSRIAGLLAGSRAAFATLVLACLCPFTANYTVVPLTESLCLTVLTVACFALQRSLRLGRVRDLAILAAAVAGSTLLRPDQGLLALAMLPAVYFTRADARMTSARRLRNVVVCIALVSVPFAGWTLRNYLVFHLFQPLAPKLAIDPGEKAPVGFQQWFRTWAIDFTGTQDAYWKYPEEAVLPQDLPARAFGPPAQRGATLQLLQQAGAQQGLNPSVEHGFAQLAAERRAAAPLRYYILLPAARLTNMLLHPRTEMLAVDERWWQFGKHPGQTVFAYAYGALNFGYLLLAALGVAGAWRADRVLTAAMLLYVLLRCALLLTIDNPEQRYTLELFPILLVLGGVALRRREIRV